MTSRPLILTDTLGSLDIRERDAIRRYRGPVDGSLQVRYCDHELISIAKAYHRYARAVDALGVVCLAFQDRR